MANRWLNQFPQTFEKVVVQIHAKISFAASGVPTLVTSATAPASGNSKGCASIAQNGTGDYTLTLQDSYVQLLGLCGTFLSAGSAPDAPVISLIADGSTSVPGTLNFRTGDYVNGAATNPGSGEVLYLTIWLSNSTAY